MVMKAICCVVAIALVSSIALADPPMPAGHVEVKASNPQVKITAPSRVILMQNGNILEDRVELDKPSMKWPRVVQFKFVYDVKQGKATITALFAAVVDTRPDRCEQSVDGNTIFGKDKAGNAVPGKTVCDKLCTVCANRLICCPPPLGSAAAKTSPSAPESPAANPPK
jgi:hypothetical protein